MTTEFNGQRIPSIGFGTADLEGDISAAVETAIRTGYRLIDTARVYGSEEGVGKAIAKCVNDGIVQREELFIQTKLDPILHTYESVLTSFHKSLNALNLDYVDLYLIHWPVVRGGEEDCYERNREIWRAFEILQQDGRVRMLGVCNFLERHLLDLMEYGQSKPVINQLELHPGYQQRGLIRFCRKHGIKIEAWSPMGRGILRMPEFEKMAQKYRKNIGQLALRWSIQSGYIPISRSSTPAHINANLDVFDFAISEEDMTLLNALNTNDGYLDIWSYRRQQMY